MKKFKIQLSSAHPRAGRKSEKVLVHKTFRELHIKTALQHSAKRLR